MLSLLQLTGPGLNNSLYPSQDSNLSVGSAHSNDGMAAGAGNGGSGGGGIDKGLGAPPVDPSPEKMPHAMPTARTPKERKRKRKNDTQQQQQQQQQQQLQGQEQQQQQNASSVGSGAGGGGGGGGGGGSAEKGVKKINDYFKHTPSSPARPQVTSTSGGAAGGQNSAPGTPTPPAPPQGFPQSLYGHHHHAQAGALSPVASSEYAMPRYGGVGKAVKSVQTDVLDLKELEEEAERKDNRIEELTRMNEELTRQLQVKQKDCDEKGSTITKCLNVVKELLIEKSTIEKKDMRAKCMQNRLRLGQFVTQRMGATFQENWTDGFAFQELAKRQEAINNEREEIDRKKKVLQKRKPSEPGTNNRKRASSSNADKGDRNNAGAAGAASGGGAAAGSSSSGVASGSGGTTVGLHNGTSSADETLFTKPPPRDGMTLQEYYEAEEILK